MQVVSEIEAIYPVFDDVITDDGVSGPIAAGRQTRSTASYAVEADGSEDFDARLLRSLAKMAVRSKRRQADVSAALCRGGLASQIAHVSTALRALELAGLIEHIVPLYDGGMLISVTSRGIEQLHATPHWAIFDSETVRV